jgi:copper chaperone CopZ
MKVFELIKELEGVDGNSDVKISIERGRGLSISDDVELYYYEENNEICLSGVESDYD